jgi:dGTPase
LTYRALASTLKYDREIPATDEERQESHQAGKHGFSKRPVKGYYHSEADLVKRIKAAVAPGHKDTFKTLECSIMDLADDIAYSTYDLEDAFKAKFLSPLGMAATTEAEKKFIVAEINEKIVEEYPGLDPSQHLNLGEVDQVLKESIFFDVFDGPREDPYTYASDIHRQSTVLQEDGYYRTDFTSKLVNLFMSGIEFVPHKTPCLSSVRFNVATFKMVEILKKYAFRSLILSSRLKITENRAGEIIETIFDTLLNSEDGRRLLPDDWRRIYFGGPGQPWRHRAVCDFIASMTDRYCIQFYSRLVGIDAPSIHVPF